LTGGSNFTGLEILIATRAGSSFLGSRMTFVAQSAVFSGLALTSSTSRVSNPAESHAD